MLPRITQFCTHTNSIKSTVIIFRCFVYFQRNPFLQNILFKFQMTGNELSEIDFRAGNSEKNRFFSEKVIGCTVKQTGSYNSCRLCKNGGKFIKLIDSP